MKCPGKLVRRVRIEKGPVLLGRPVLTRRAIYLGWDCIYRVDAKALSVTWQKRYESCTVGAVCGGVLVIGNAVNELLGLNIRTGEALWSRAVSGGLRWRDRLVVIDSGAVAVIDPLTGDTVGALKLPDDVSLREIESDLLLYNRGEHDGRPADGEVAACVSGAYNLANGTVQWERQLLDETVRNYQAPGNTVSFCVGRNAFVATKADVGIFGCSLDDGRILWHQKLFVPQDVPTLVNGKVYVLTRGLPPKENAKFMCFDELTGEKVFETEHEHLLAYRSTPGTVTDDHIVYGNEGGMILAFRLSDGELEWSHRTRADTWQPSVMGDRLYVTTGDGYLLVFESKQVSRKSS